MKNISKKKLILMVLLTSSFFKNKIIAENFILPCTNEIPDQVACLINASSYDIKISKIDICQDNPFPVFRSIPDFNGSKCINLFNNKNSISSEKIDLKQLKIDNNTKINEGDYKYLTLILKNEFIISGEFKSNNKRWITTKKGPKDILLAKDNLTSPSKFKEKLNNWRGQSNLDNKYCKNNGGTYSRCDIEYNGDNTSVIGVDANYVETYGNKAKYIFYIGELSPQINLENNLNGYLSLKINKNLEVYGDGDFIKSISIAPFSFKATYQKN